MSSFNTSDFLNQLDNIRSFNGKVKYADQNLERIGSGTGRIVYSIDDNKALKLAKNPKGIAQNEVEEGVSGYHDTEDIVTEVFEHAEDYSWLLVENAKKVSEKRIKELTGIPSLRELHAFLYNTFRQKNVSAISQSKEMKDFLWENEFASNLANFVGNYGQVFGDMNRPSSYGEVIRNGKPTIVLTDYGIDEDVSATHYKKKRPKLYELHHAGVSYGDHLADIGNVSQEVRHGMWAFVPAGVGDGVELHEEFVNFVMDKPAYPKKETNKLPMLSDIFHDCLNNFNTIIKSVKDPIRFTKNLIALQNYLISHNYYNKPQLFINDKPELNEEVLNEGVKRDIADHVANKIAEKKGFNAPQYIGGGFFGVAYDIGDDKILKITSDHTEANHNLKLKNKNLERIATPYEVYKINIKDQEKLFAIVLEKLETNIPEFNKHTKILDEIFNEVLGEDISEIIQNHMSFGGDDLLRDVNLQSELQKHPESTDYLYELLSIADELNQHGINTIDFVSPTNLGYKKDGKLAFFDVGFGDYFQPISKEMERLDVDEEFAGGGGAKFTTYDNVSAYDATYNNIDTSPSIRNDLDANSALYNEDLEYKHVDDATKDKYIMNEDLVSVELPDKLKNYGVYNIKLKGNPIGEISISDRGIHGNNHYITIDKIFIHDDYRGRGFANSAMKEILDYANKNNIILTLTPDNMWGASKNKLINWYKSLGFVMNTGKRKDFYTIQLMYRIPENLRNKYLVNEKKDSNFAEGVGDKYLHRRDPGRFPEDEFEEFEQDYQRQNIIQKEDVVFDRKVQDIFSPKEDPRYYYITIVRNPKNLGSFMGNERGVIDKDGNLYLETKPIAIHQQLIEILDEINLVNKVSGWEKKIPTEFITVQRSGKSNKFFLGESNVILTPLDNRRDEALPYFKEFLSKARIHNPQYTFIPEMERIYRRMQREKQKQLEITEDISRVSDLSFASEIKKLGGQIYSVGGAVRDEFLGKESKDLDVIVTGIPLEELGQILSKYGKTKLVGESYGVYKFIPEGSTEEIDITIPRTETPTGGGGHKDFITKSDHELPIEKDLYRRDFTINAMAKDIDGNIIDPYGGQEDLQNKIIKAVNPEAFSDDPLRMLRAVQFASRFGFTIEPHTFEMIRNSLDNVDKIAMDRRYTELNKIREKGDMKYGAQLLKDTGLFKRLFGYELNQSIIDNAPFDKVNTTAEFIFLILQESQNPEELFITRIHNLTNDYKKIKALKLCFNRETNDPIQARMVAHDMHLIYPDSLKSQILPNQILTAANELLSGKYPKTVNELAVDGHDLMALGLQGGEIKKMKNHLLINMYSNNVTNTKEELLDMTKNNKNKLKEEVSPETIEKAKKNIPIQYTGIVVDDSRKDRLLKTFNHLIPDDWQTIDENMHVTIKLGGLDDHDPMNYHLNLPIYVRGTHIGVSDKAIALRVDITTDKIKSKNEIPHITLAYNKNAGAKPKDSNEITDWRELKRPINIRGVFQEVPYKFNV